MRDQPYDGVVCRQRFKNPVNDPSVGGESLTDTVYYIQNGHGDVVGILSEAGITISGHTCAGGYLMERVRYTPYGVPTCYADADVNLDGVVDFTAGAMDDYHAFLDAWSLSDQRADLANDGAPGGFAYALIQQDVTDLAGFDGHNKLSRPDVDNRLGYASYMWDPRIKRYHVRNRVYNPYTTRWQQRDPVGLMGGWNTYQYCGGMPNDYTDPRGLLFGIDTAVGAVVGSVVGVGIQAVSDLIDGKTSSVGKYIGAAVGGAVGGAAFTVLGPAGIGWGIGVAGAISGGAAAGVSNTIEQIGDIIQGKQERFEVTNVIKNIYAGAILGYILAPVAGAIADKLAPVLDTAATDLAAHADAFLGRGVTDALKAAVQSVTTRGAVTAGENAVVNNIEQRAVADSVDQIIAGVEEAASPIAEAAQMQPYGGPGGGHHIVAKSAFAGARGYDANAALAVPNAELLRLGVDHGVVTGGQQIGYRALAQSGAPITWRAVETIETQALIRGGMQTNVAQATVRRAIQDLKDAGVSGPVRIPWGGK